MCSRDSDSLSIDLLFKAAAGEEAAGLLSATRLFFIYLFYFFKSSRVLSPCCSETINHVNEAGGSRVPLTADTAVQTSAPSQPVSRSPQDKCFYICNQKHNTYRDAAGAALDIGSLTILCFNKYQTQTRLGASGLRNVSEGSTITHNKWAYANTGLFVMHKSLFGVHGSDAVC